MELYKLRKKGRKKKDGPCPPSLAEDLEVLGKVRKSLLKMVMFALSCERLVGVSRQMFRQIGSENTAK